MRTEIFPSRYGCWDQEIELVNEFPDTGSGQFEVVFIGTPPDSHIALSSGVLEYLEPDVLVIEKPLAVPSMDGVDEFLHRCEGVKTRTLVGYNHLLTENTLYAEELIRSGFLGKPLSIHVRWQECWKGILSAHPWLSGPEDSYLGYCRRGGGALSEHSHGVSLWLHFAGVLGCDKVATVNATRDCVGGSELSYDRTTIIGIATEGGLYGSITQDVIEDPPTKTMRIQGTEGFLEWYANYEYGFDCVIHGRSKERHVQKFSKTRVDDFQHEIDHVGRLIENSSLSSPIDLSHGVEVMQIINSVHQSKSC